MGKATQKHYLAMAGVVLSLCAGQSFAELKPVSDNDLSGVTGGTGLSIDLSSQISMGGMTFEDSGQAKVSNLNFGGAGLTTSGQSLGLGQRLDDLTIAFDISQAGALNIGFRPLSAAGTIDWGMSTGAIDLVSASGQTTRFADGLEAWGTLLSADFRIQTDTAVSQNPKQYSLAVFTLDDLDLISNSGGLSVGNLQITGTESGGILLGSQALTDFFGSAEGMTSSEVSTAVSGAENGFAVMSTSVGTEQVNNGASTSDLRTIRVNAMAADVNVGSMGVGGVDLGAATLDNLRVSDTTIRFNPY
ncbi:DUF6160 family protein [Marinobacter koreensis]|uniref:DUF6160 family protein n=1 Tax=Marinobacter koreensis TaxID=335974 RepID=A0ABW0RIQ3_9GAMM|nr:DUF6160 family protein [Marinobacter koreensis]MCK7548556.1 DUF6160 family protein [Marinobacter koreensis]